MQSDMDEPDSDVEEFQREIPFMSHLKPATPLTRRQRGESGQNYPKESAR
jgi:hypothetical protein